jgi:hypothetical protein
MTDERLRRIDHHVSELGIHDDGYWDSLSHPAEDLLALVAEVRRLRAEVSELHSALRDALGVINDACYRDDE